MFDRKIIDVLRAEGRISVTELAKRVGLSKTPTQTLYKLDLPAATPQTLDESLKILSGMMEKPTLTDAAVALVAQASSERRE